MIPNPYALLDFQRESNFFSQLLKWHVIIDIILDSFKNQTEQVDLTGSTKNRPSIWSGYGKKPKMGLKPVNSKNQPV